MDGKKKNRLDIVLAVIVVAVCVFMFLGDGLEHIEDINGTEDYSLTMITDQQIVDKRVGALNVRTQTGLLSGMVEVSSNKFTGVYEVVYDHYIAPSDFVLNLYGFTVTSGNFKMCVVQEGKIVDVLEPGEFVEYQLEDVTGTVSLVIAGESAEFCFQMTESDYDSFSHS